MLSPQSDDVGGLVVCQRCQHSGPYLKAHVRNPETERLFREKLACSSCGSRDYTLVPKQEDHPSLRLGTW
jgi:hypothetical protein